MLRRFKAKDKGVRFFIPSQLITPGQEFEMDNDDRASELLAAGQVEEITQRESTSYARRDMQAVEPNRQQLNNNTRRRDMQVEK